MKIDIYTHILPEKYLAALTKKAKNISGFKELKNRAATDIEMRLKLMDRYPDVLQVLTISLPPLDTIVSKEDAVELARIANDEMAELVIKYPNKFAAGVACLPLIDIDKALEETNRAIVQLGLKGIQIFARVNGSQLDDPSFNLLYQKMANYNLPIWIHPVSDSTLDEPVFGWPYATASAMRRLVVAGVFDEYPEIKFITHHGGGVVPYCAGRVEWLFPLGFEMGDPKRNWNKHFSKFYGDTASYGNTPDLMCGFSFFGADHLLFGTDSPLGARYGVTQETIDSIERMSILDIEKEKIFSKNATNLLRLAT
jgi:uncharacterized protein